MAARYWVGDTNPAVWNDTGHWSTSDGGAGGASVPGVSDDVYFTSSNTNDCTVDADISIASLTITSGYTGTFDNATNDKNVTVSGDVTLDGTRVDMGDGTWTVSGNFDNYHVTAWNANSSTLVMDGGTELNPRELVSNGSTTLLNKLTISQNAYIIVPSTSNHVFTAGEIIVSGTINITAKKSFGGYANYKQDTKITSSGHVTGEGTLIIFQTNQMSQMDGIIDVAILSINGQHNSATSSIVPAVYDSALVRFQTSIAGNKSIVLLSGNYTFNGNVQFWRGATADDTYTVDNSTNNPNITFNGGVTLDYAGSGTFAWTKGTGTLTFAGTSAQSANFADKSVEDIVISNTTASVSLTTNGVTTDGLTVDSGATFDLNGENLSYASASSTTNNGTIRLQGGETLTNVSDLDTDSGTVVYYGDNGGGGSPFTIKDFGTTDYYNLTFDATLGTDVFRPADTLTVANDLTITQGTFDNATNDENINVTGNVTMDNTRTDMGDATWTVSGNFDNYHVTTFKRNASTLVMNGTAKSLTIAGSTKPLHALNIASGASITASSQSSGVRAYYVTISGSLYIDGFSARLEVVAGTLSINDGGSMTGHSCKVLSGAVISSMAGNISVVTLTFENAGVTPLVAGTYSAQNVTFYTYSSIARTLKFPSGDIYFDGTGDVKFFVSTGYAGNHIIDNSNNPNLYISGDLLITNNDTGAGQVVWQKGTGTITFGGTTAQTADFLGKTVEDINITNTSADVSITNDVTCDSLSASDNASIKVTAGKTITTDSVNDLGGSAGNLVTVASSSPGDVWYLIASGTPVVSYINVTDSDASGGSEINTVGSVDGGNNTNWVFAVIRDIIQAGIIIFKR